MIKNEYGCCMHGLGSQSTPPAMQTAAVTPENMSSGEYSVYYVTGDGVRYRTPAGDKLGTLPKGTKVVASKDTYGVPGQSGGFRVLITQYGVGGTEDGQGMVHDGYYPLMSSTYLSTSPPAASTKTASTGSGKTTSSKTTSSKKPAAPPTAPTVQTAGPSNLLYFAGAALLAYFVASRLS